MPIIKNHIDFGHEFTMLPNQWVRDSRLSHRARGVLAVVMSHADGWETSVSHLVKNGKEGRDAIYSAVGELVELGYLVRSELRSSTGKFEGTDYEVADPFTGNQQPLPGKPYTEKPYPEKPYPEKPYPANPQQEKNNLKKNNLKENQPKKDSAPKGAHSLPSDWMPDQATVQTIQEEHPTVNLGYEHKKFTDYWNGVRHLAKGRKTDWNATWRNWMRRVGEQQARQSGYKPGWQKRGEYYMQQMRQEEALAWQNQIEA